MKVGIGFDIHPLVEGRKLILGGVNVPFEKGLLGHSDGDVLIHSIADAILGAASLGDIGKYFPDKDLRWKDISSLKILEKVKEMIREKGLKINNIDTTLVCERPSLSPFREEMVKKISSVLEVSTSSVNVKFKTAEGLGEIGKGNSIASFAVATIIKLENL